MLNATVNTMLELGRKNTQILNKSDEQWIVIPTLFQILNKTTDNWLVIKLLKVRSRPSFFIRNAEEHRAKLRLPFQIAFFRLLYESSVRLSGMRSAFSDSAQVRKRFNMCSVAVGLPAPLPARGEARGKDG